MEVNARLQKRSLLPATFLMTDSPLTINTEESTGADVSSAPAESSFFRSPALPSGFVRVCLYLIVGDAIGYALLRVSRSFLDGTPSPYDPRFLMAGESVALIGAFSSALLMSLVEKRAFGAYGLPLHGAFGKFFRQEGLYTFVRWNTFFTNPPLCITEAELRESFAIIDRGLDLTDRAVTN